MAALAIGALACVDRERPVGADVFFGAAALPIIWNSPQIITLAPWSAIIVGGIVIGLCWLRVWLRRDPIRLPTSHLAPYDA